MTQNLGLRLYVGGLSNQIKPDDVSSLFSKFGKVQSVEIAKDSGNIIIF